MCITEYNIPNATLWAFDILEKLQEVASVSKGDQKFCEALKDPLYAGIRAGLDSAKFQNVETQKRSTFDMVEGESGEQSEDESAEDEGSSAVESEAEDVISRERNEVTRVEEVKENDKEGSERLDDCTLKSSNCLTDQNAYKSGTNKEERPRSDESCGNKTEKKHPISPKVEKALETLENLISIVQEQRSKFEKNECGLNSSNLESSAVQPPAIVESGGGGKSVNTNKNKKSRFCCLHFIN